ncbi:MAG: hypothetical protein J7L08_00090 [Candidatus Aenigmarchaeota archaeon]|nr:hypothetical protein [Candidatus Aenigmarchaeota archaeon]
MILDAIKYEVGLAYNYLGWLGYFNKNNGRLLPYYPVKKLRGYEVNAGGSIFLQQVLEDIIELKPPKITKYLSADLNCLSSIADDLIDHDGEDLERFRAIIEDPSIDVPEEWKLVKFLAEHVQNVMGDNYNEMKAILPSSMESLKMELDAKTKEETILATERVGEAYGDFGIKLAELYTGKNSDKDLRRAAQIPFIIGNFIDDLGDIYDDLGKKNTYVTLLYDELKDRLPKKEVVKILQKDVDGICKDFYDEGLSLVGNKDAYRLMVNSIMMRFNIKRRKTMRKF